MVVEAPAPRTLPLISRTPTFCAGCPHRGTSNPMQELRRRFRDPEYMRRVHGRDPIQVIAHGGIGCYSMNYLPPFSEMDNLSAMGLGGATGAGAAPLVSNKHYTLVGDGTFFHGEISTIANAIKQNQDILYVILDNKNTAMTGHQGTPASATDLMGRPQHPLEIEEIVRAMGPSFLQRANPDDRDGYMALLERALLMEGTRIVIADKECAITSGRRTRRERERVVRETGYLPEITRYNIVEEVCENCRACTVGTGCPGLAVVETTFGEKVAIDGEICVDDGYCSKIKACPSFELVTVNRRQAPASATATAVAPLPEPHVEPVGPEGVAVFMGGVGGMGIGVVSRILTDAAAGEFAEVDVYQKKGLAQRGGGVFCDMVMHDGDRVRSALIPDGHADLVIGLEAIEGVRALAKASPERTAAVINTAIRPTTTVLMGSGPPAGRHRRDGARADAARRPGRARLRHGVRGGPRRPHLRERVCARRGVPAWLAPPHPGGDRRCHPRGPAGRRADANLAAFTLGRRLA